MKKIVYILCICLLILPIIQQLTGFPKIKNLFGSYTPAKPSSLSCNSWFTNSFQEKTEKYLNENFGFRNSLVRFYNQIQFSLFNEAHARGVIVGKKDYLFELNYIKAYYGTDFKGYTYIKEQVRKLAAIRDTLHTLGVEILPILACGKASFFPEFIPDSMRIKRKVTNYEVFTSEFKKNNISFIDFHSYIRSQKGKTKYPIYTKYGIHWSQNTMIIVADSIISYIEKKYHYSLPHIKVNEIEETYLLQGTDCDIAHGMNLISYHSDLLLGYPKISFSKTSNTPKPKVITISDSYWWGIYNYKMPQYCFDKHQFWYYFNNVYSFGFNQTKKVSDLDLKKEIESQNIICIMATDGTLRNFGWGFIDSAYSLYFD